MEKIANNPLTANLLPTQEGELLEVLMQLSLQNQQSLETLPKLLSDSFLAQAQNIENQTEVLAKLGIDQKIIPLKADLLPANEVTIDQDPKQIFTKMKDGHQNSQHGSEESLLAILNEVDQAPQLKTSLLIKNQPSASPVKIGLELKSDITPESYAASYLESESQEQEKESGDEEQNPESEKEMTTLILKEVKLQKMSSYI